MIYGNLGRSGLQISRLSFGSWVTFSTQVDTRLAKQMFALAYEAGVNFFDNAEVYAEGQSELIMGQALKELGWGRDTYMVSSKVFWGGEKPTQMGLSRKHVREACDAALKRLQVDYLDMYFCHRPDILTPIEETVNAMSDLVRQGKVLYWGTSEWSERQIAEAYQIADRHHLVKPTMEQPEYNLFKRDKVEAEFASLYRDYGLGTTIWSPLASGLLSGKYSTGIPKDTRIDLPGYEWLKAKFESPQGKAKIQKAEQLGKIAKELGLSTARMSIAWCLKNPNVSTVILGASKIEQLTENLKAIDDVAKLTSTVMKAIEDVVQNQPDAPMDFRG